MIGPTFEQPCYVQGGRFGDLILLLPAWKAVSDRFARPVIITSREFASVFEGVSYVDVIPTSFHWTNHLDKMWAYAKSKYPNAILTQLMGHNIKCPPDSLASYSFTMWERTGLLSEYQSLPLVFDRRNPARENALRRSLAGDNPYILTKWHGITSPFGFVPDVYRVLRAIVPKNIRIINLDKVVAHRVFDLIGVMDGALGMLTGDTMTLHLGAASIKPYIAFTRDDGQARSIPKGKCVLNVGYGQTKNRLAEVEATVKSWLNT